MTAYKPFTLALLGVLLLFGGGRAWGQLIIPTAHGIVGAEGRIAIRYTGQATGPFTLSARLKLSNPTVFYPQRFVAAAGDTILARTIKRDNDSMYQLTVTVRYDAASRATAGDTVCYLAGEMLAGADTITSIELTQIVINGATTPNLTAFITSTSIGPPIPYVRFASLDQNYPNPVPPGLPTTFAFRIDQQSDITFYVYDVLGKQVYTRQYPGLSFGVYTFSFTPTLLGMSSGAYWVRMVTVAGGQASGEAHRKFQVVR